jgi:hypothetical protein
VATTNRITDGIAEHPLGYGIFQIGAALLTVDLDPVEHRLGTNGWRDGRRYLGARGAEEVLGRDDPVGGDGRLSRAGRRGGRRGGLARAQSGSGRQRAGGADFADQRGHEDGADHAQEDIHQQ